MLRIVLLVGAFVAFTASAPSPANVFEINITPEEAQQYLNSPPFTSPQLSGRTAVLPLVRYDSPQFRAAEAGPTLGHYWKNGKEIENTQDYVEEVYDASQFHGQDGLGAYAYGYQTPESSKVENRARSGDVNGAYTYKSGDDEIKVRYWADSEGFHQEDNLPKVELQPVQEAEDVRQARLAHEKAWQEAAAAAAQQPDPQGEYSPDKYEYQGSASEQQQSFAQVAPGAPAPGAPASGASAQVTAGPGQPREGKAYYAQASSSVQTGPSGQNVYQQKSSYQQNSYQQSNQPAVKNYQKEEEVEPTGPPQGFFYSFNYPVSIIQPKSAAQGGVVNPGHPVDHDTVYQG